MNIPKKVAILAMALISVLTSGCATNNWSIVNGRYGTNVEGKLADISMPFLINQKTGDTWMLWGNQTGYDWKKVNRNEAPTKP